MTDRAEKQRLKNQTANLVFPAEERALFTWARGKGILLSNTEFNQKWRAFGCRGESENDVYFDPSDQRWHKRNNLLYHSSYLDYFYRIAIHNTQFPEAKLRFEGFVIHNPRLKDGDRQRLLPVVTQPDVRTETGASPEVVDKHMSELGFARKKGTPWDYYNERTGVHADDMHNENVFVDEAGNVSFIDPHVYMDDARKW